MRRARAWAVRLAAMFRKQRRDRELAEELESHLQFQIEDKLRAGLSPQEARRQAIVELGGIEQAKEIYRDRRGIPVVETVLQDLRYGARMLRKNPGFTAVAVLTLALGIGANLTIFNVAKSAMIMLPPVAAAERMGTLWASNRLTGEERSPATASEFQFWRQENRSFEDLAAYASTEFTLAGGAEPTRVFGNQVSESYFRLLGVAPILGRTFLPDEFASGGAPVVVLSYGLWQRSFGADPKVLGRAVTLGDRSYTVTGVMPAEFFFPYPGGAELYVPLGMSSGPASRTARVLMVVGRLRSGVSRKAAQAELDTIAPRLERALGGINQGWGVNLRLLREEQIKRAGGVLVLMVGPAFFVLLIACGNVANMLLARASARQGEMAVRVALGASRTRIVRQLLSESVLLASLGGGLGLLLALWGIHFLRAYFPGSEQLAARLRLDLTLLLFGIVVSAVAVGLFGLSPALRTSRVDINEALKAREPLTGRGSNRTLLVCEIALAVVFPMVTVLLVRAFRTIERGLLEPGFDTRNVLTLRLSARQSKYAGNEQVSAFYRDVLDRIAGVPGVTGVGAGEGVGSRETARPIILTNGAAGSAAFAVQHIVTPGFIETLKIPLRRGRQLSAQDSAASIPVALVNETMARRYWPGQEPLGKRFKVETGPQAAWITVAGVTGDVIRDLRTRTALPTIYLPHAQHPDRNLGVVVRTGPPPGNMVAAVKAAIWAVDAQQALDEVESMEQAVSRDLTGAYFVVSLIGAFGVLAVGLAAAGVYGMMSYTVAQRTREFGIRIAIGAEPGDVGRMLLRQVAVLIGIGLLLGLTGTVAVTRLLGNELPPPGAGDAISIAVCALLLVLVALLAMYIPARRATRVDPMVALRYE